jgi:hypothetical protein
MAARARARLLVVPHSLRRDVRYIRGKAVRFMGLDGTFTAREPVRRYSLFGEFIM